MTGGAPDKATLAASSRFLSGTVTWAKGRFQSWAASDALNNALLLTSITIVGLFIRLFRLHDIPAEMWGDVVTHRELASAILHGNFFYLDYRFGGDGPMLSYIVAGLSLFLGLTFFTLKLATVLIGTSQIVVNYFLAHELFSNREIAFLTSFLTAVSFWTVTFSRQAKPYILVPLFAALAVTFALRHQTILAGVALGFGMYTQASFWGMPLVFLIAPVSLLAGAEVAIPFLFFIARDPSSVVGSKSYIGEKLTAKASALENVPIVFGNVRRNALSFNVRGDAVFRHNIPLHPHLDVVSGLFFLVGFAFILWRIARHNDRRLLFWFLVPFCAVQLPSVLDHHAENVPAMGRMVGVTPFVFCAVACAIWLLRTKVTELLRRRVRSPGLYAASIVACLLATILGINAYNYFNVYPRTLPNGNTPFGRTIAERISASSPSAYSVMVGCCWGQYGQPEPGGVLYMVSGSHHVLFARDLATATTILHRQIPRGATVSLYVNPAVRGIPVLRRLPLQTPTSVRLRANSWDVAWVIEGRDVG